jgi:hypothetical protein
MSKEHVLSILEQEVPRYTPQPSPLFAKSHSASDRGFS